MAFDRGGWALLCLHGDKNGRDSFGGIGGEHFSFCLNMEINVDMFD